MVSKVYFIDMRTSIKENFIQKLQRLLITGKINSVIKNNNLVAIKLHFGEFGNVANVKPVYVGKIVELIKSFRAIPFITDANTLYAGSRSDAPAHLTTASKNGFVRSVVGAPLVIADGLRGKSEVCVQINSRRFINVYIAKEIFESDSLISVAHFKGHELTGFGGSIKNIGMGCASRKGKLAQHSSFSPKILNKLCKYCKDCINHCSQKAIYISEKRVKINDKKCIGCGECIIVCTNKAIQVRWDQSVPIFMEKMVEYTKGVLLNKINKSFFINFITDVSPACDCHSSNDAPIVKDIGVLCSKDLVAIDQASVDLVNNEVSLINSCLKRNIRAGQDKFKGLYPNVNWEIQLDYAEKIGIGSRKYDIVKL